MPPARRRCAGLPPCRTDKQGLLPNASPPE